MNMNVCHKHSEETKAKVRAKMKGRIWINNGEFSRMVKPEDVPAGWKRGKKIIMENEQK